MKKILRTIICLACCYVIATYLIACSDQDAPSVDTNEVKVQLTGLNDDLSGLDVQLRNINTASVFIEKTNAQGIATFNVTPGLYEALTSQTRNTTSNEYYSYNGTSGQITVLAGSPITATIPMKRATISRLVIKAKIQGSNAHRYRYPHIIREYLWPLGRLLRILHRWRTTAQPKQTGY